MQKVPDDVAPMLRGYVDEAADQVAGIQKGLRIYDMMLPDLPQLLGNQEAVLLIANDQAGLHGQPLQAQQCGLEHGLIRVQLQELLGIQLVEKQVLLSEMMESIWRNILKMG